MVFGLVCFAWIFFRAKTAQDAFYIIEHLGAGWSELFESGQLRAWRKEIGVSDRYLATAGALILALILAEGLPKKPSDDWRNMLAGKHLLVRWSFYVALVLAVVNLGAPKQEPFIYFQF